MQLPLLTPQSNWQPPTMNELPEWNNVKRVAIDCETSDPTLKTLGIGVRRNGHLVGVSFALEDGPSYYLPIRHRGGDNLPEEQVLRYLRTQATTFVGEIVGANLSYDLDYLWQEEIFFPQIKYFRDIQIADPLIYELHQSYSLQNITHRLGLPGKDEVMLREAAHAYGVDPKAGIADLPARFVGPYGEADAEQPLLALRRQERLIDEKDLWGIYNLESRVLPVLVKMRRRGVRIDTDKLQQIEDWALTEENKICAQISRETGLRFHKEQLTKPQALAAVLENIGVKVKKTSNGRPNVDQSVLESINHPVAKNLLGARKINRIRTTFVASIKRYLVNGRIHSTFNQIARETDGGAQKGVRFGRLSSEHPNVQQQPTRDEIAKTWRSIYLPEEGAQWGCLDYCFSRDTEILTEKGFIRFDQLSQNLKIAAFNRNGRIYYAIPKDYQIIDYSGDMISVNGRFIDLLMSPNHNCVLMNKDTNEPFFCKAKNYHRYKNSCYQPNAGFLEGTEEIKYGDILWGIAIQRGVSHHYKTKNCPLISKWDDKIFNREFLLKLKIKDRLKFISELTKWHGSGYIKTTSHYNTQYKENATILQEIGTLSGLRSTLKAIPDLGTGKTNYTVTFRNTDRTPLHQTTIEKIPYTGKIYCVTMPYDNTIIVRRNGKVSLTGNSQQEPRWTTHFAATLNLPKAADAVDAYHNDPLMDNHQFMSDLTGLSRTNAKQIFLGLCYGEGGAKLCDQLQLPTRWAIRIDRSIKYFATRDEAFAARAEYGGGFIWRAAGEEGQAILDQFDERAPYIRQLARIAQKRAQANGFIVTRRGRRLHFPQKPDGSYDWTHKTLNRVIQGSAADQNKDALVLIDQEMPDTFLQLPVHDEFDGSFATVKEAQRVAVIMRDCTPAKVPFRVDIEMGPNWADVKPIIG